MHEMHTTAAQEFPQGEMLKGTQATSITESKPVPKESHEYETLHTLTHAESQRMSETGKRAHYVRIKVQRELAYSHGKGQISCFYNKEQSKEP